MSEPAIQGTFTKVLLKSYQQKHAYTNKEDLVTHVLSMNIKHNTEAIKSHEF